MIDRFADTFYFLALLNERDAAHGLALKFAADLGGRLISTDWVLIEVADALAVPAQRPAFLALWDEVRDRPLLLRGLDLYTRRPDKAWSLTDCISSVVMADRGQTDAFTGNRHFEQAGFRALLRSADSQ